MGQLFGRVPPAMDPHIAVALEKLTNKEITRLASAGETAMTEDEMFTHTLQQVTKSVFPKKALMLQKFYMSHYMRKGRDTKTKEYRACVATMNAQLPRYLPFKEGQAFLDDDLKANAFFNFLNS